MALAHQLIPELQLETRPLPDPLALVSIPYIVRSYPGDASVVRQGVLRLTLYYPARMNEIEGKYVRPRLSESAARLRLNIFSQIDCFGTLNRVQRYMTWNDALKLGVLTGGGQVTGSIDIYGE